MGKKCIPLGFNAPLTLMYSEDLVEDFGHTTDSAINLHYELLKFVASKFFTDGDMSDTFDTQSFNHIWAQAVTELSKAREYVGEYTDEQSLEALTKLSIDKYRKEHGIEKSVIVPNEVDPSDEILSTEPSMEIFNILGRVAERGYVGGLKSWRKLVTMYFTSGNLHEQENFITYAKNIISSSIIDTEVRGVNNEAKGLRDPSKTLDIILRRASGDLYVTLARAIPSYFQVYSKPGNLGLKYDFFEVTPDTLPSDVTTEKEFFDDNKELIATMYYHGTIKSQFSLSRYGKAMYLVINKPDLVDAAMISYLGTDNVAHVANIDVIEQFETSRVRAAHFANILVNELPTITKTLFPALYDQYFSSKPSEYRTGFADEGSVSAEHQDSQKMKLFKETTPRIIKKGNKHIQDPDYPYLTVHDWNAASSTIDGKWKGLSSFDGTREGLMDLLEKHSITDSHPLYQIFNSIYQRFYSPKDYIIQTYDPIRGSRDVLSRSLASIYNLDSYISQDVEEYRAAQPETPTDAVELTENVRGNFNAKLNDITVATTVTAASNVAFERVLSRDFRSIPSNTRVGDIRSKYHETMRLSLTNESTVNVNGSLTSTLKVTKTVKGFLDGFSAPSPNVLVKNMMDPSGARTKFTYYFKINKSNSKDAISGANYQRGIPITVTKTSFTSKGELPFTVIRQHFGLLGIPELLFESSKLEALAKNLILYAPDSSLFIGEDGNSYPLETFFLNYIYILKTAPNGMLSHDFMNTIHGFDKAIIATLESDWGSIAKTFTLSFDNKKLAVQTPSSKFRKFEQVLEETRKRFKTDINTYSFLASGKLLLKDIYSKVAIKVGDVVKDVSTMTELENIAFLITEAYVQRLSNTDGKSAMFQGGVVADRSDVPMMDLLDNQGGLNSSPERYRFLPKTGNGAFDKSALQHQWLRQNRRFYRRNELAILDAWKPVLAVFYGKDIKGINSITDLKSYLDSIPLKDRVKYDYLRENTPLVENIMIVKDEDGNATISEGMVSLTSVFRSAEEAPLLRIWKNEILPHIFPGKDFSSIAMIEDLQGLLETINKDNTLLKIGSKTHRIAHKLFSNNQKNQAAGLRVTPNAKIHIAWEVIDSIISLKNNTSANDYLKMSLESFKGFLDKVGFNLSIVRDDTLIQFSELTGRHLSRKNIDTANSAMKTALFNDMVESYFYNQSTLATDALNILTGGVGQYTHDTGYKSYFPHHKVINKDGTPIKGIFDKLIEKATEGLTAEELAKKYDVSDRRVFIALVRDSNMTPSAIYSTLLAEDLASFHNKPFVDQLKRNAGLGTTGMMPELVGKNSPGLMLEPEGKVITIYDPIAFYKLAGIMGEADIKLYDGAVLVTDLYQLKVNNSLGNDESNFATKGTPTKDATLSSDKHGYNTFEKKATFNLFSVYLGYMLSPEAYQLIKHLFTAVNLGKVDIYTEPLTEEGKIIHEGYISRGSFITTVTPKMWMSQGLALREVLDTEIGPDGKPINRIVSVQSIVHKLRRAEMSSKQFRIDLENGRYKTDKVRITIENMHDLWEHFGSITNLNSFKDLGRIIGNYAGLPFDPGGSDSQFNLKNATYPLRNAYVEKIVFKSAEKAGGNQVASSDHITDPFEKKNSFVSSITYTDKDDIAHTIALPKYHTISYRNHVIILNPDHEPDTTSDDYRKIVLQKIREENLHSKNKTSTVSLITQVISANAAQGRSPKETQNIQNALSSLSVVGVEEIINEISADALENAETAAMPLEAQARITTFLNSYRKDYRTIHEKLKFKQENADIMPFIEEAYVKWSKDLLIVALEQRNESGVILDLVKTKNISLELRQIFPYLQNKVFAEYNTRAVKYRLGGGQYVVSPSNHFIRPYDVGNVRGLTRDELNELAYGDTFSEKHKVSIGLVLTNIGSEQIPLIGLADKLEASKNSRIASTGQILTLAVIRQKLRRLYLEDSPEESFESFVEGELIKNFQTRLGQYGKISDGKGGNDLQGQRYRNKDGVYLENSDEYVAWQQLGFIKTAPKDLTGTEFFSSDGYYEGTPPREVGVRHVPVGMARMFFFSNDTKAPLSPEERMKLRGIQEATPHDIFMLQFQWTAAEEIAFLEWYDHMKKTDLVYLSTVVYDHMRESILNNPNYSYQLEIKLEHALADISKNWSTEPAEFLMPAMHAKALLLNIEHKQGKRPDTIHDFIGFDEQPDINLLVNAGIITLFNERFFLNTEKDVYDTAYLIDSRFKEHSARLKQLSAVVDKPKAKIINKYITLKHKQRSFMKEKYKSRVIEWIKEKGFFEFTYEDELGNIREMTMPEIVKEAMKRRERTTYGELLWDAYNDIILEYQSRVNTMKSGLSKGLPIQMEDITDDEGILSIGGNQKSIVDEFIDKKVNILVDNFSRVLEFISARIPAQGKQSYVAAKIKQFVHATRNSSYSPILLYIINGEDLDIDKHSVMVYSMNEQAEVIDWWEYNMDKDIGGIPERAMLIAAIEEGNVEIDNHFRTATLISRNKGTSTGLEAKIKIMKFKHKNRQYRMFTIAVQNAVVYNLLKTIKAPYNAIEAATPISLAKTTSLKRKINYLNLKALGTLTPAKLLNEAGVNNPHDPASMVKNERLTQVGKVNIGISASGLKAFLTVYNVFTNIKDPNDVQFLAMKSYFQGNKKANILSISTWLRKLPTEVGDGKSYSLNPDSNPTLDPSALQFFKISPEKVITIQNITSIANASIHTGIKRAKSDELNIFLVKLTSERDSDRQFDMVAEYTKGFKDLKELQYIAPKMNKQAKDLMGSVLSLEAIKKEYELTDISSELVDLKAKMVFMSDEEQAMAVIEHLGDLHAYDQMLIEPQAWEDLSEILTAATDNAKVMILGAIGITSETNSIVSTMIMMGIDIKEAVTLMLELLDGKDDMSRKVMERINNFNDVHKSNVVASATILTAIRAVIDRTPRDPSVDTVITSPVYRILPWALIASEYNSVAKFAQINQGMKVPIEQDWVYRKSLENSINRVLKKQATDDSGNVKSIFYLEKFIKAAHYGENSDYVQSIIVNYDKVKTGINVPLIFKHSKQFFSYFIAMFEAKDSLSMMVTTPDIIYLALDLLVETEKISAQTAKDETLVKNMVDHIYGLGVDMYFKNTSLGKFSIYGFDYDLSTPEGRDKFIFEMPSIRTLALEKEGLKNNPFLLGLRPGDAKLDYKTQTQIKILKIDDVMNLPEHTKIQLESGINVIETEDEVLYHALFMYALVTGRGKYAGGSYASLFGVAPYMSYSNYLDEHIMDVLTEITDINNYRRLIGNNQGFIKEIRTNINLNEEQAQDDIAKLNAMASKRSASQVYDDIYEDFQEDAHADNVSDDDVPSDDYQEDVEEGEYAARDVSGAYLKFLQLQVEKFYMSYHNLARRVEEGMDEALKTTRKFIKSIDNGLTYEWNEILLLYVPLVQKYPQATIPFQSGVEITSESEKSGIHHGWLLDSEHGSLTVYAYVEKEYENLINGEEPMSLWKDSKFSKNFKFDLEKNYYIVKLHEKSDMDQAAGGFTIMEQSVLEAIIVEEESVFYVNGPKMNNVFRSGERQENAQEAISIWVGKNGHLYNSKPALIVSEETDLIISPLDIATDKTTRAIYDEEFFYNLAKKVRSKRGKVQDYSLSVLESEYSKMVNRIIELKFRNSTKRLRKLGEEAIAHLISINGGVFASEYNAVVTSVREKLSFTPPHMEMLVKMYNAKEIYKSHLKKSNYDFEEESIIKLKKGMIPSAALELMEGKVRGVDRITGEVMEGFQGITSATLEQLEYFLNTIIKSSIGFSNYVYKILFEKSRYVMYQNTSGKVYIDSDYKKSNLSARLKNYKPVKIEPTTEGGPPSSFKMQNIVATEDTRARAEERLSDATLSRFSKFLSKRFEGVEFLFVEPEEMKARWGIENPNQSRGFINDRLIVYNKRKVNITTPLHEFSHIYFEHLKRFNRGEYDRLSRLALKSSMRVEIEETYPTLSEADLAEEIMVEAIARSARDDLAKGNDMETLVNEISEPNRKFGKLIDVIMQYFYEFIGTKKRYKIEHTDSFHTAMNKLGSRILYDKASMLSDFTTDQRKLLKAADLNQELTLREARRLLRKSGFIVRKCI